MRFATCILLGLVTLAPLGGASAQEDGSDRRPTTFAGRSTVYAPRGTIATSQPLATAAGLEVLQDGGNAVDAAVTAAAVLNVTEPHMTGAGGDVFAILWLADEERLTGLSSHGRAGSLATAEELRSRGHVEMPTAGAEAVTVPGAVAGWAALLEEHGTISLAEALAPAIRIAREGFPVTPIIADQWAGRTDYLMEDSGARATYLIDGERAPKAGEWFRNPDLARSFRTLAEEGSSAMYGGELGRKIVRGVRELGGFLTLDDLRNHEVEWVQPLSAEFGDYTLWELPPATQGVAALEMLRILQPFDLEAMGHNSARYLHHLVEAKKLAFADMQRHVADPDFMEIEAEALLDDAFVRERRDELDPGAAAERVEPGRALTDSETIYLSAADSDGNMISFINSVFSYFGSGVVVPGTGFVLQNRGAGFTLEEGHPNRIAPGKKPFHTLIPGFVTRGGEPWMAFGVMGGSMQPQGHVQVLLNLALFGMDPQEAIDAPRFRHYGGRTVGLETPVADGVRDALRDLGHEVRDIGPGSTGGAQAVIRLPRGWAGASDPRKDGMAAGH